MSIYKTLQNGSSGSEVKKLQQALMDAGYNVGKTGVDGIYGSETAAAVKAYQKANNLTVDGIAGDQTLGNLYGGSTATSAATTSKEDTSFKYEDFKYNDYTESDIVKQADAMLKEHMANKPGEYQSSWQSQLTDTLNKILNREEFAYDLNGDALYQQYKDQYTTQGKQAMMDTMGQAAAMTGGYGNSYAQTVGQQTYQGYLQQLNDKVPELYQLALSQYNQEGQDLKDQAALMAQQEEQDYGRYRDSVSDYYTNLEYLANRYDTERDIDYTKYINDRDFAQGQHADKQGYLYQLARDAVTDEQWQKNFDEAKRQYDESLALSNSKASSSGSSGNGSGNGNGNTGEYDTHGYTTEQIKSLQKAAKISADGIWGAQTQAAYEEGYRPGLSIPIPPDTPYTYEETPAVTSFFAKIRTKHEFARGINSDNTKYKTYKDYVKGMLEKYEGDLTDNDIATISQKYGLS